jgi:hypothetical protein
MTIFSLPYLNFEFEKKAKKAICAEKELATYKKQLRVAPSNCMINYGLASDVMRRINKIYDFIFLDMCGSFSQELVDCIKNATKYMKPDANIAVTVLKAREPAKWRNIIHPESRDTDYIRFFRKHKLFVHSIIKYKDTSPMMVIIASRKPNLKVSTFEIK